MLPEIRIIQKSPSSLVESGWGLVKDQYWLLLAITFAALLIAGLFPLVLMGPALCGIFFTLSEKAAGREIRFENVLKGFDYFVESLLVAVFQMAAGLIVFLPVFLLGLAVYFALFISYLNKTQAPSLGDPLLLIVTLFLVLLIGMLILVMTVITSLFNLAFPLVIKHKVRPYEAVKLSLRAGWANLRTLTVVNLILLGLSLLGLCLCFVGSYLLLPIAYATWYRVYEEIFEPPPPGTT